MDAPTKALVETIGNAGSLVMTGAAGDRNSVAEATDTKAGERYLVRADDLNRAVVDLARQVGIGLEDG